MVYNIGKWTPSTYKTLKFIYEAQSQGEKIRKLKDFPSGTMRNWFYPLKEAGYISNGDGYSLTEKGIELMKTLQETPPIDKRGRKRNQKLDRNTKISPPKEQKKDEETVYRVLVEGKNRHFEHIISAEESSKIIQFILTLKK